MLNFVWFQPFPLNFIESNSGMSHVPKCEHFRSLKKHIFNVKLRTLWRYRSLKIIQAVKIPKLRGFSIILNKFERCYFNDNIKPLNNEHKIKHSSQVLRLHHKSRLETWFIILNWWRQFLLNESILMKDVVGDSIFSLLYWSWIRCIQWHENDLERIYFIVSISQVSM